MIFGKEDGEKSMKFSNIQIQFENIILWYGIDSAFFEAFLKNPQLQYHITLDLMDILIAALQF